jgi:hypothetical protein
LSEDVFQQVQDLYRFSHSIARVTFGTGLKTGSFSAKFDQISVRSIYTVYSDGRLELNFVWLEDNPRAVAAVERLGAELARIPGFNLPPDFRKRHVSITASRWTPQLDKFKSAVLFVVNGDYSNVDDESTIIRKSSAIEFNGDDIAYLDWLAHNPEGYVVNTARAMNPKYMVLHRASCTYIGKLLTGEAGGITERGYVKICAPEVSQLQDWVKKHGRPDGSFSNVCGACRPNIEEAKEVVSG